MSLPHSLGLFWTNAQRLGVVNSTLLGGLLVYTAPFAVSEAVAVGSLAVWLGVRLWRPAQRRRRVWSTAAMAGALLAKGASLVPGWSKAASVAFTEHFLPRGDGRNAFRVRLLAEVGWRGVVFFVLLRAIPVLAPMAPIALPVLVVGVIVLPLSLAAFSVSTFAVIAYELARTAYSRFVRTDSIAAIHAFQQLIRQAEDSDDAWHTRQHRLAHVAGEVDLLPLEPDLRDLEQPFLQLLKLSDDNLLELCRFLEFTTAPEAEFPPAHDPRFASLDAKMLPPTYHRLKRLFTDAYTSRPSFTQDASFLGVSYQLAGVLVHYLPLPLPGLAHLAHPPRPQLLAHLLLTPFLTRYLLHPSNRIFDPAYAPAPSRALDAFAKLNDRLPAYLGAAQAAGMRGEHAARVLEEWVGAAEARVRAVEREERASGAVLSAVLAWKARREERSRGTSSLSRAGFRDLDDPSAFEAREENALDALALAGQDGPPPSRSRSNSLVGPEPPSAALQVTQTLKQACEVQVLPNRPFVKARKTTSSSTSVHLSASSSAGRPTPKRAMTRMVPLEAVDEAEGNPFEKKDFQVGLKKAGYTAPIDTSRKTIKGRFVHGLGKQDFKAHLASFLEQKGLKPRGEYMVRFQGPTTESHSPFVHLSVMSAPYDTSTVQIYAETDDAKKPELPTTWTYLPDSPSGESHWACKAKRFWPVRVCLQLPTEVDAVPAAEGDEPHRPRRKRRDTFQREIDIEVELKKREEEEARELKDNTRVNSLRLSETASLKINTSAKKDAGSSSKDREHDDAQSPLTPTIIESAKQLGQSIVATIQPAVQTRLGELKSWWAHQQEHDDGERERDGRADEYDDSEAERDRRERRRRRREKRRRREEAEAAEAAGNRRDERELERMAAEEVDLEKEERRRRRADRRRREAEG
ncbi:hypothetical protein JCM10207_007389 [Rhodosporidiobolus poonsookiae]